MAAQCKPRKFLRQISNALLKECFDLHDANLDIPWADLKDHEIDPIYDAWQELPGSIRGEIDRQFEEVESLASEQGIRALTDVAALQKVNLTIEFEGCANPREMALYASMYHPDVFSVAWTINHAESHSTRFHQRWTNMPKQMPNPSEEATEALRKELSSYYMKKEGRGRHCTVEKYVRPDLHHYYLAYLDDFPATHLAHNEQGVFMRFPVKSAFEHVFIYDPIDGVLDISARGGKEIHRSLQAMFCRTMLYSQFPTDHWKCDPYDLSPLRTREFLDLSRQTDPTDRIEEIQVRRLRFAVRGCLNQRIILEANPRGGPSAIYQLLEEYLNVTKLDESCVELDLAQFHFRFVHVMGQRRRRTITFDITAPNSSSLKNCSERHRDIAEKYLRRWGIDRTEKLRIHSQEKDLTPVTVPDVIAGARAS